MILLYKVPTCNGLRSNIMIHELHNNNNLIQEINTFPNHGIAYIVMYRQRNDSYKFRVGFCCMQDF